jgi:hypothetical protein
MSPWVLVLITIIFAVFTYRWIRDSLQRDYRLPEKAYELVELRRHEDTREAATLLKELKG